MHRPLLLIKTGFTLPEIKQKYGDFEQMIIRGMEMPENSIRVVCPPAGESLPSPDSASGIVITGSHGMVSEHEDWSERISDWLSGVLEAGIPVLGICYGHQLLAHALGGESAYHPLGREVGTVKIFQTAEGERDPLFENIPREFLAQTSHSQTVHKLPQDAVLLAWNEFESVHAYRIQDHIWGVQFHPEFNPDITRIYTLDQIEELQNENQDPDKIYKSICTSEAELHLLCNFAAIVREYSSFCTGNKTGQGGVE